MAISIIKRVWRGRLLGLRLIVIFAVVGLLVIGQLAMKVADGSGIFAAKQRVFIALGVVAFVLISLPHYRLFGRIALWLYAFAVLLLFFVLAGKYLGLRGFVPVISGSTRWLQLGPLRIQPSEIAKLAYIVALAWQLHRGDSHRTLKGLIAPFALTLLPMALILLEPDLGTVLLFLPVLFVILFVAGARAKHLLAIIGVAILASPLLYFNMANYQKTRVQVLLKQGNTNDVYWMRGAGYQLNQSKICVGSGHLTGRGWGNGIFVDYERFLPEKHNDFVFALIANQAGFLGCLLVLAFYLLIVVGGIEIAAQQPDSFGQLLAVGISTLIATQMFINIGVTVGLMPVTGMTLPLVSYGGSSLLSNFLALGLLFNVARHRTGQMTTKQFDFID